MLVEVAKVVAWCVWPALRVVRGTWDLWVSVVMWVVAGWRRKSVLPPVFNPTLLLPASSLAHDIRERKMSSVEVVRAYVTRISNVNPILNALAQESFQAALLQAKVVDERLDQGYRSGSLTKEWVKENQPLLGVPFTVKETIAVAGLPHTGGLKARNGRTAARDARVVTKMKKAGAILLCTTNVSELGMWWESDNPVYGRTNNPYDTRRTPGGSSGGEAALMCACGSPVGLGTDTGGSIRIPAFFCGLFGHKPTAGLVSTRGCNIHDNREYSQVKSPGPLARHASDLALILAILAGDHVSKLNLGKPVNPGGMKIYTLEGDGDGVLTSRVDRVLVQAQRDVTRHFQRTYDCIIHKVNIPGLNRSYQVWKEKLEEEGEEGAPMFQQLADNKGEINVWTEVTRALMGRRHHTLPSLVQAFLGKLVVEVRFLRYQRKVLMGREEAVWKDMSGDDTTSEAEDSSSSPSSPGVQREIEWRKDVVERRKSTSLLSPPSPWEVTNRKDSRERRNSLEWKDSWERRDSKERRRSNPFLLPYVHPPMAPSEVRRRKDSHDRKDTWERKDSRERKNSVPIVLPQAHRPRGETQWKALQMKIQRLLGESGVLIYPSHPTMAPYHSESFLRPLNFSYTAVFNALGFPVTQVPLGLAPNGLPLGVQVVGGMYQDHLTIALAQDLEKAFGGWVCPSKIL
ncbi:hypothetical protein Pcinc_011144 [Petrolisthes cinctipes]|uniref:Amidase domain-containing protein n=1 Tax=Petrolisthes cinctipes TaxID=88211 RepID=A0AAE1KUQ2_PETCI|nr:hypothetical protein Pcinc_011144 [Petrolisthes cinctipes]